MPEMNFKIKGRGLMSIVLKYKNVPRFCFNCGRMGHATANCGEGGSDEQGIHFGEELSPHPLIEQEKSLCSKYRRMWCINFSMLKDKGSLRHTGGMECRVEIVVRRAWSGLALKLQLQGR
jgi:hypothetical protein